MVVEETFAGKRAKAAVFLPSAASKSSSISAEEDFLAASIIEFPCGILSYPFSLTFPPFVHLLTDLVPFLVGNLGASLEVAPLVILLIRPETDQSGLALAMAYVLSPVPRFLFSFHLPRPYQKGWLTNPLHGCGPPMG